MNHLEERCLGFFRVSDPLPGSQENLDADIFDRLVAHLVVAIDLKVHFAPYWNNRVCELDSELDWTL